MITTKKRFTYEAELAKDELGGYSVSFPDVAGAYTFGKDLSHSIEMAAEVLQLILAELLDEGKPLPRPRFQSHGDGVLRIAVSVEITPEFIESTKCMTVTEAAEELGITTSRVSQMLNSGILQAVPFGKERLVTIASINDRKENQRKAGRPKKECVAS